MEAVFSPCTMPGSLPWRHVALPAPNCSLWLASPHTRRDGRLYLRVDWTSQQVERFDQAAWLTPVVHESASPEAMQPTLDIIKVSHFSKQNPCVRVGASCLLATAAACTPLRGCTAHKASG